MGPKFEPLFRNAHLATIAGNFWPRTLDEARFPAAVKDYRVDQRTIIRVFEHQPETPAVANIVFLHGLEGSADAGYIRSFAQAALERGFRVHRKNLRTCGGTEQLCQTMYHSGLTGDVRFLTETLQRRDALPTFVVGFSLGGNVTLKLAGELGETDLLAGVCAVSTPIDLAACVRTLDNRENILYARRFLKRLKERVARKSRLSPDLYSAEGLDEVHSIWEFDDRYTAPLFGFGTAANYYSTQSAARFLDSIRIPALVITAQDDPLVPFSTYGDHTAFGTNPALELWATEHGGHVGFIARHRPRFWLDSAALGWIAARVQQRASESRLECNGARY